MKTTLKTSFLFALSSLVLISCATKTSIQSAETTGAPSEKLSLVSHPHELKLMSWNMKHLGRKNLDYDSAVKIIKQADVIAIQEVVSKTGKAALEKLGAAMEKELGEKVCEGVTDMTTGTTGRERYAVIWLNSKVSLQNDKGKFVEDCPSSAMTVSRNMTFEKEIDREPLQATFKVKGSAKTFTLLSIHLVPTAKKPAHEVPWLFKSTEKLKGTVIVVGDFNLGSDDKAFDIARKMEFKNTIYAAPTSLKMKSRSLNEAYDNIWAKGAVTKEAKVINLYEEFPQAPQKTIYDKLSDHSPVMATVAF